MTVFIFSLIILAAIYIVFILGPAIVAYATVFCRKDGRSFEGRDLTGTVYEKYSGTIADDFAFFRSLEKSEVSITADDGVTLFGDLYSRGLGKLAICVHGYNSTPLNCFASPARFLYGEGYDILLICQRAHGKSGGSCSTLGLMEQHDILRWIKWADARPDTDSIILYGTSMGCATVAYASDKIDCPKVKGLVLDCGFTSPYVQISNDCKKRHIPDFLLMPVIRLIVKLMRGIDIKVSTDASLSKARIPCLFTHCTEDETVPLSETEHNYEKCSAPKELYIVPGELHSGAFMAGGEKSAEVLGNFLRNL